MSLLTGAVDKRLERANYKNVRQEGLRAFYDDTGQLAAKGDYTKIRVKESLKGHSRIISYILRLLQMGILDGRASPVHPRHCSRVKY